MSLCSYEGKTLSNQSESDFVAEDDANAPKTPPPPVLPPPIEGNKDGEGYDGKKTRGYITKYTEKPEHWTRYAEAGCAILLVLITGTYTHYAGQQSEASIRSANAARTAACVASRTLDVTVRSNQVQEAANRLAAQTTLDNIRLEQRAWVEIDDPKLSLNQSFPGLTMFLYSFYLKNVGKTSAQNIRLWFDTPAESGNFFADKTAISQFQLPIDILKGKYIERVRQAFPGRNIKVGFNPSYAAPGVLAPGVRTNTPSTVNMSAPQTRKDQIPAVFFSYLIGRVEYSDTFGKPHWMNFCFYIADDKGDIQSCQYGNDEDPTLATKPTPATPTKQAPDISCPADDDSKD